MPQTRDHRSRLHPKRDRAGLFRLRRGFGETRRRPATPTQMADARCC